MTPLDTIPPLASAAALTTCERADQLQAERDGLRELLRNLVHGDVGQNTLWKLSQGQGTETADGKTWLVAKALIEREDTAAGAPPTKKNDTA
jgi:hypothetical protein